MNIEKVQSLAEQAGDSWNDTLVSDKEFLARFADLVAAAEREACAKIVEEYCAVMRLPLPYEVRSDITKLAAQAIRARGEK